MHKEETGKMYSVFSILAAIVPMIGMAIPVVEFSREGYKIRKVFG